MIVSLNPNLPVELWEIKSLFRHTKKHRLQLKKDEGDIFLPFRRHTGQALQQVFPKVQSEKVRTWAAAEPRQAGADFA